MTPAIITLIILVVAIILFMTEKIPVNLTVMLTMTVLVLTGLVTPEDAVSGFASKTILMLIGVVIVGSALFETGVTDMIAGTVTKFAKTEKQMIMSVFVLSTLMSSALSNSGTVAVFIPIIMGLTASTGYSRSRMMMAAFLGSMTGGRLTLVGDAAINVLIGDAIVELGGEFNFFTISKIGIPIAILAFLFLYFFGHRFLPYRTEFDDGDNIYSNHEPKQAPKWKQVLSVVILLCVFVGMIFEKQTGIPSYMVAIIGAVVTVLAGIFKEKQAYQMVSIKTIILLGGMVPLATALKTTGAAQMMADSLIKIIGGSTNPYLITVIIFLVSCAMTQFMSNVVTCQLLTPIIIAIAQTIGVNPISLLIVLMIASTHSLLTPIACPPANLVYSYGGFRFSDYFKSNIWLTLASMAACIFIIPIFWPLY